MCKRILFTEGYHEKEISNGNFRRNACGDSVFYGALHLYDVEDPSYYTRIENVVVYGQTANGKLWYIVNDLTQNAIYLYDTEEKISTTFRTLGASQSISSTDSSYIVVRDYLEDSLSYTYNIYFFDDSLNNLSGLDSHEITNLATEDVYYTIFETKNSSGVYSYYLLSQTEKTVK